MKKPILSILLFLIVFVAAYLALCFLIPGLRIKLDAPPAAYFRASITHMLPFKAVLSLLAGAAAAAVPLFLRR